MKYLQALLIFVLSLNRTIQADSLTELASKFHTDKGAKFHNYTPLYEKYFDPLKNKPLKVLEIGFYRGESAHMLDAYFTHPETKLYFIDINQRCYKYTPGLSHRCSLHLVNQEDANELLNFASSVNNNFDIIIDDGGHTMTQQIVSFKTLFPLLNKHGIYIIEDLHTSYWASFGSKGSTKTPEASTDSAIRFLQNLIDDLNYCGAKTECADKNKCPQTLKDTFNIYQKDIASLHFYTSLCFIFKN